jgi:hypothetical protein
MQGVLLEIVKRQIRPFCKADPQNGAGVDKRLGIEIGDAAVAAEYDRDPPRSRVRVATKLSTSAD